MISWIQISFQRHFRTIFLVLLGVLIVSFIFTIGATPGIGRGDRKVQARMFFDLNLSSPEDQNRLYRDANLSIFLMAGPQQVDSAQIQEYALQRYAALYLANQANLPEPSAEQLKEFIQTLRAFVGPTGAFDPSLYATFRDNLKLGGQFSEADVARVLSADYRAQAMQTLLGGPGYVDDSEVSFQLERTDTTWSADIAKIDYASYAPTINPTDDQLQTYFAANAFRYESLPQVRVNYVEFPATRYFAQVTLTDADVRAYYDANPARFPKPETAADAATPTIGETNSADADFLAVQDQVSATLRYDRARRMALQAASDLTVAMFDAKLTPANAGEFLAKHGETLRSAEAFSRATPPQFLAGSQQSISQAFNLSAERPISDAVQTIGGAAVLIWQESIPSSPSLFVTVADRVKTDFIENEKRQSFVALGKTIRAALESKLTAGTSFADAVAGLSNTAGAKVSTVSFADFSRRNPPQDFPYSAANSLEQLSAGQVSDMVIAGNEGLITYAAAKVAPVADRTNPRFEEVSKQLASYNAAITASSTLNALVAKELGLDAASR